MPTLTPKRDGHHHRGFITAAQAQLDRLRQQLVVVVETTIPDRGRLSTGRGHDANDDDDDYNGHDDGRPTMKTTSSTTTATTTSLLSMMSKKENAGMDTTTMTTTHLAILPLAAVLQGLLAILLVYHSVRATFFPCAAFGPSAAHLRDPSVCDDYNSGDSDDNNAWWDVGMNIGSVPFLLLLQQLPTSTFCRAALYLISGFHHGHLWWKASIDTIRRAVVTRLTYLLLLGAAVTFLTTVVVVVDTNSTQQQQQQQQQRVALITGSMWLTNNSAGNPPFRGVLDLIQQMTIGWWAAENDDDDNNPVLSYLTLELMGTVLVAGLVLLLKASPHRLRTRWMMILLVGMLVPSVTRTRRFDLSVHYNVVAQQQRQPHNNNDRSLSLLSSSENDHTVTTTRSIGVDPFRHAHILAQIISDNNNNFPRASSSSSMSALRLAFAERPPDSWYNNNNNNNNKKVNNNNNGGDEKSRGMLHTLDESSGGSGTTGDSTGIDNAAAGWLDELLLWKTAAAYYGGAVDHSVSTPPPWIEGAVGDKWGTKAPWIMSSSFVAGAWISEAVLSSSYQRVVVFMLPASARPYVRFAVLPLLAALLLLCGTYPATDPLVATNPVWRMMRAAAGHVGLTDAAPAQQLWSVVGATLLMLSVVGGWLLLSSSSALVPVLRLLRNRLIPQQRNVEMVVDAWSKIALSLFLVHLPILHSVGCGGFLFFHHYTEDVFWAAILTALVSAPIYLTAAVLFDRLIDRPAQVLSTRLSRQLLGLPTTTTTTTGSSSSSYYHSTAPGSSSNESTPQQKQPRPIAVSTSSA